MFSIFRKEINLFFSSLIGYIVIGVFLVVLGLFMFVFPDTSLLNSGFASLDQFFSMAPNIFVFLIPAITMRSFAEEQQNGTLELLFTRPISDAQIILGKYLASFALVVFALLPTLLYYYTVYQLGAPKGNLDAGGIMGSYFGLLFLGATFVAIGLFSSAITSNQIVAFLLGTALSFWFFWGFNYISSIPSFVGRIDDTIQNMGMLYHYDSLSRGVLDSRDIIYFVSISGFFFFLSMLALERAKKTQTFIQFLLAFVILVLVNVFSNSRIGNTPLSGALDLTEEKRFTLTPGTKKLLESQKDVIFVRILLEGAFPAGFKRLQEATREMLEDFRSVSPYIEYEFYDPNQGTTDEINARREKYKEEGMNPVNLRVKGVEGTSTKSIFPYAIFRTGDRVIAVNILENEIPGVPSDVILNNAVALLEYKFASTIQKLGRAYSPIIAFTSGQGELETIYTADLEKTLRTYYEVGHLALDSVATIPQDIAALVIAKPTKSFSEKTKFKIDQYVMNGGKILWLLDRVAVSLDSLKGRNKYFPKPYELNLDDLLFRYGLRFNNDLILDMRSTRIPLATGVVGNAPQFDLFRYPYHVLALPQSRHPIVRSLDAVNLFYPSSIDISPRTKHPVEKTILLMSSASARYQKLPVSLDFDFLRYDLDADKFKQDSLIMAVLLEGNFTSLYENRLDSDNMAVLDKMGVQFQVKSPRTSMIVVSDGDVIVNPVRSSGEVLPLGLNVFEKYQFSNKDFIINSLEFLLDEGGVIQARGKEVKLRMLNSEKATAETISWQLFNIGLPVLLLVIFGFVFHFLRKRKYAYLPTSVDKQDS